MPYLFTCPHCKTQTQVDDQYSGMSGKCVTCGGTIEMPRFAAKSVARPGRVRNYRWVVTAIVSVTLLGCLLFALLRVGGDTMDRLTTQRQRSASMQNLQRIAVALNAYAADHGTYPPSASVDAAGKKLHSWRVLILPYLDEEELYNQFDLNSPWDHQHNRLVAREMPQVYQHPNAESKMLDGQATYQLITGNGTLFPASGPLSPNDVIDSPGQTILLTEAAPIMSSGLWTEPIDLDFAVMQGRVGGTEGIEPGGVLDEGVVIATVDGRGHFLPSTVEPITFRALVTPKGGEPLADDTLD